MHILIVYKVWIYLNDEDQCYSKRQKEAKLKKNEKRYDNATIRDGRHEAYYYITVFMTLIFYPMF